MTKAELINAVSAKTGATPKLTGEVITATLEQIKKALAEGDAVEVVGFGKFYVADREERKGRNPRTGEEIVIPAHKSPCFSAGKTLKDAVNG